MLAAKGLTRKDFDMRIGEAAATAGMGSYNLEMPFSDSAVFYSFGDVSHRRGDAGGFYRYPVSGIAERPRVLSERLSAADPADHGRSGDHGRHPPQGHLGCRREPHARRERVQVRHRQLGQRVARHREPDDVRRRHAAVAPRPSRTSTSCTRSTRRPSSRSRSCSAASSASRTIRSTPATRRRTAPARRRTRMARRSSPARRCSPASSRATRSIARATTIGVYAGVETEIDEADRGRRRRPLRELQRLRPVGDRQGSRSRDRRRRARRARRASNTGFRAPSLQQLWFSNVVDAVLARRDRRAAADAGAHEQQREPGDEGVRHPEAARGEVDEPLGRHRVAPARQPVGSPPTATSSGSTIASC